MATRKGRRFDGTIVEETVPAEQATRNQNKLLSFARMQARERTISYLVSLIQTAFPDIEDFDDVRKVLGSIVRATVPAARSNALTLAVDRYVYARDKIVEINSMTRSQANAYDPTTDTGWP